MVDQSKPWDFKVDSENAIPEIYNRGENLRDGHGIVDFRMHWHTNDERGPVDTKWQVLMANKLDPHHLTFISAIGSHVEGYSNEVPTINQTCEEAERWLTGADNKNELTMHLNLDCSDALKGLKAVQREARSTAQALKEVSGTEVDMRSVASVLANPKLMAKEAGITEEQITNIVNALEGSGEQR